MKAAILLASSPDGEGTDGTGLASLGGKRLHPTVAGAFSRVARWPGTYLPGHLHHEMPPVSAPIGCQFAASCSTFFSHTSNIGHFSRIVSTVIILAISIPFVTLLYGILARDMIRFEGAVSFPVFICSGLPHSLRMAFTLPG